MKLLITPALKLTEEQCEILREKHELFFLDDERNSVDEQQIGFDLKEIEGIVCNFFFVNLFCSCILVTVKIKLPFDIANASIAIL